MMIYLPCQPLFLLHIQIASALLSTTATLPDVLLGFYKWLDEHPTETVLMSIKVDNATFGNPPSPGQPSSKTLQLMLYQLLTQSQLARDHWLQEDSKVRLRFPFPYFCEMIRAKFCKWFLARFLMLISFFLYKKQLGTLGAARGKLIFIQRIDWTEIRSRLDDYTPIGIPLPPQQFNDNDPDFSIVYNPVDRATAYVEDFYNILPNPEPILDKFNRKFDAVKNHLVLASARNPTTVDQLFITFASGGALLNSPPVTPKVKTSKTIHLTKENKPPLSCRLFS
jgi:1-phosphatidylinositol phosphodiesterase